SAGARRRAGAGPASARLALAELAPVLALVVLAVLAGADRLPPPGVVAVPLHRPLEPLVEADARPPAERLDLVGAQRVAEVVARAVADVLDERLVGADELDDPPHDLDVLLLVRPADVVDLARPALAQHEVDRTREVLDVEPVAHLAAVAVDGQVVAVEGVEDHERDEL